MILVLRVGIVYRNPLAYARGSVTFIDPFPLLVLVPLLPTHALLVWLKLGWVQDFG
jgi:hypothetical protein